MDKKEIIPICLILFMFILAFYSYPKLPEKVPSHWNSSGEIDNYSNKFVIFLIPIILLGIYLLFLIIPKIEVFKKNIDEFYKTYMFGFKLVLILFFMALYIFTLLVTFNYNLKINYFIFPALGVLFYYIGYMIKNVKRNFFIGIRTPWTLANDKVWKKTHERGSLVFKILGVYTLIFIFFTSKYSFLFFLIPLFILIIYLFVYSYLIFKKEKVNKL